MDADATFEHARLLAARGRSSDAAAVLDALLAQHAGHVGALLLRGNVLLESRDGTLALGFFERAAAAAPRSAEALDGLARCLHALGRNQDALVAAREAQAVLNEGENYRHAAPVYLTLVWCLRELRRYKEALAAAEQGLARTPDAVLAQWASVVEEELALAEKEEC